MKILNSINGWQKMSPRYSVLLYLLSFVPQQLLGQSINGSVEAEAQTQTAEGMVTSEEKIAMKPNNELFEMLEFLGEFETEEGKWVEPELLLRREFSQLEQPVIIRDEND